MTSDNSITSSHIFGPVSDYVCYQRQGVACINIQENYQKRSYRNRYDVLTSQGVLTLTVPLKKGKHQQMNIRNVEIAYDENWIGKHVKTITSAYSKSAWFEHFSEEIFNILRQNHEKLFDLNHTALTYTLKALHLDIDVQFSDQVLNLTAGCDLNTLCFPTYNQVFEYKHGFLPNLSILDLLFCLGPESGQYLKKCTLT